MVALAKQSIYGVKFDKIIGRVNSNFTCNRINRRKLRNKIISSFPELNYFIILNSAKELTNYNKTIIDYPIINL